MFNTNLKGQLMFLKFMTAAYLAALTATTAAEASTPLTPEQIRERLEIKGEIFVLDASGKHLILAPSRTSVWRSSGANKPISVNSGNGSNDYGQIFLHHVWDVKSDGSIQVLIEEYRSEVVDDTGAFKEYKDLLKKSEFTVENFAPVIWKVQSNREKNVIFRLTPYLREETNKRELSDFPVAGQNMTIMDNQGYAWADRTTADGLFVAFKTHRGTVALSYRPFAGAKEAGTALGNDIVLRLSPDLKVTLHSESAFLPAGISAKVYAVYDPDQRSSGPGSVSSFDSNKEESFLKNLNLKP